ncbi:hypothetical protein LOAG_03817, partial [Loa loa]
DMVKQNDGEILGPLEIDVSEMATTTYGCDPEKLQRESAESLHHRCHPFSFHMKKNF